MTHHFPVTVYYEDTDMGGIVYHANYLKFIERARSDWVRALGIDQNALRDAGTVFAVHRIEADFLAPARLDEQLQVRTHAAQVSPARLVLVQQVWRAETCLFKARATLVAMSLDGRPRRLPPELAQITVILGGKP
ncbi:tol-pal system-associated acyl-CoA thioesterase [Pararhodobacter oceanensis]|uniref:Tol-pal system-associated acyl-CoA thioesterase n=1 Tax=Pararhodobacter oceanensis TaxID=2172121 RepID=A0A2T8HUE6_9RHOB|nr:tol-pal system-associated acyl-CoA thioesterase [Pararhodobacter oceanensis]PVH29044.1 tol-pal system-associated acyl-CoA thioesterase [Pararhodobacter oceanensis]